MVNFQQLNIEEEESVQELQITIDNMVQYDENRMPSDKHFMDQYEQEGAEEMPDNFDGSAAANDGSQMQF